MSKKQISVLGLGAMGARMGQRLLDAGHDVVVYNRTPARADVLKDQGAKVAATPREAANGRDIVISMVRDDEASWKVWLDPKDGALGGLSAGALAIESSTLTPAFTHELAGQVRERGAMFLDAPVAGSRPQAEAGQLIYLVGGAAEPVESAREVLLAMGGAVHHVGPAGAGMALKLAVNALFGIQVVALGEVLGMLQKSGIATTQAVEVLGAMPITSPALRGVGGLIAARKFAPMFPIELVEKDFHYVEHTVKELGGTAPTVTAVRAVFQDAKTRGLGDENIVAVAKLFDGTADSGHEML